MNPQATTATFIVNGTSRYPNGTENKVEDDTKGTENKDNTNGTENKDDTKGTENTDNTNNMENKDNTNNMENKDNTNDMENKDNTNNMENKDNTNDMENKDNTNDTIDDTKFNNTYLQNDPYNQINLDPNVRKKYMGKYGASLSDVHNKSDDAYPEPPPEPTSRGTNQR